MTSPVSYNSATSSTSSVSGLISGMDTKTLISQLMQIEAQPQQLLKNQLADTQTDAAAYRQINTSMALLSSAAQALTKDAAWTPVKASSSSNTVSASATAGALAGSLSFTVNQLSSAHSIASGTTWTNTTDAFGLGTKLTFQSTDGTTTFGSVTPTDSDGDGTVTLADVVSSINKANLGYTATAVDTGSGFRLQVTSTTTGQAKAFQIVSDTQPATAYSIVNQGQDAKITIGSGPGAFSATSATNTFAGVMDGTTFTVSQAGTTATVTVGQDNSAITAAVQSMVDAANKAISTIKSFTDSSDGSTAPLKGNWTLTNLAAQIATQVSSAVGTTSPAKAGLQLNKDGTIAFDAGVFSSALSSDPALARSIMGGITGVGQDNVANTPDDTVDTDGIAARLAVLAEQASDSATGMLTSLANSQDARVKDLQDQIADWDLRLQQRQQTLTNQFTAMESMLGTLQNQSSWLNSQINSLPSWNSSSKK